MSGGPPPSTYAPPGVYIPPAANAGPAPAPGNFAPPPPNGGVAPPPTYPMGGAPGYGQQPPPPPAAGGAGPGQFRQQSVPATANIPKGVFIPGSGPAAPPPVAATSVPPQGRPPQNMAPPPQGGMVGPPPTQQASVPPPPAAGAGPAQGGPPAQSGPMRAGPGATTRPGQYAEAAAAYNPVPDAFGGPTTMGSPMGQGGGGGAQGGNFGGQAPANVVSQFDPNDQEQCNQAFMRMTVNAFPSTSALLSKWSLPFGAVIQPLADYEGLPRTELVNFGAGGIVRCKACRTYINPFVRWLDGGRKWQCNMCMVTNHVGPEYFCPLDPTTGRRQDYAERPELNSGSCEFVAPLEYMVRPPQAPVYLFVIDVSYHAVQSGMLTTLANSLKASIQAIPGDSRTQVGFIAVNSGVALFNLKASLSLPQMIVLPDPTDVFLPIPDDLLVNLADSMNVVTELLTRLPAMFQGTTDVEFALGPALQLAFQLIKPIGGKMIVLAASLPSVGQGRLKVRDAGSLGGPAAGAAAAAAQQAGAEFDTALLQPADDSYKSLAVECVRQQVSIDVFSFSNSYADFATLGCLAKYTCGEGFLYPNYSPRRDGAKFRAELIRVLTRETGFEAVMRVRLSRGLKINKFFGHYFVRGADLLSLPTVDSDKAFGIEIGFEESSLGGDQRVCLQSALLYTTSGGERRIRVHTQCLPVTSSLQDMYKYADVDAITNLSAKMAIDRAMDGRLSAARDWLKNSMITSLKTYAGLSGTQRQGNQLVLPETLKLLPLYTLALHKNPVFTANPAFRSDARAFLLMQLSLMPVSMSSRFIHPRLFNLTEFGLDLVTGVVGPDGRVGLPPLLPLTSQQLSDNAVLLLDDAVGLSLWIGRNASNIFLTKVLGMETLHGLDPSQIVIEKQDNDLSRRFTTIIRSIRGRGFLHQQITVVPQGDRSEIPFLERLIEDRTKWAMGYLEFLTHVHQQVAQA